MVCKLLCRPFAIAAAAVSFLTSAALPSLAADATATGIDGSFTAMLADLTGMLGGNFGALVLLVSLIIAVGVYAITSRVQYVVASLMVAFLIGYGVDIIQGIGGVTASVGMLASVEAVTVPAPVLPVPVN